MANLRRAAVLLAAGAVGFLLIIELAARTFADRPGSRRDRFAARFRRDPRSGYQIKPFALLGPVQQGNKTVIVRANSEGFIGPERAVPKPANTFRILAVGDSLVEGLSGTESPDEASVGGWPAFLEARLNHSPDALRFRPSFEVINAGVGGYLAWQAARRLEDRGLKYTPDLVLVEVGWNDLQFSSLPDWRPFFYSDEAHEQDATEGPWAMFRAGLLRHSHAARMGAQVRRLTRGRRLAGRRQLHSGAVFNEDGLRFYLDNLEYIYALCSAGGARMGLVLWPVALSSQRSGDVEVSEQMVRLCEQCPLSGAELWIWYRRYIEAQRRFAAQRPDVLLIDPLATFAHRFPVDRDRLFADLVHLKPAGNHLLAEITFEVLRSRVMHGFGSCHGSLTARESALSIPKAPHVSSVGSAGF